MGISRLISMLIFFIISLQGCQPVQTPEGDKGVLFDFPDILNYTHFPDSISDRSAFAFSDKGAWHGFALPGSDQKNMLGSFAGPFLMTRDNGVWMTSALSRLKLQDGSTGNEISLENAQVEEQSAYPGLLRQVFSLDAPALKITAELIFVSGRTSFIRVKLENRSGSPQDLQLKWSGKSWLPGVRFSPETAGVRIAFDGFSSMGGIAVSAADGLKISVGENKYEISLPARFGRSWETCLAHTFCFTEAEWDREQQVLSAAFKDPERCFVNNETEWNRKVTTVLKQLPARHNDRACQEIAVKCLLTLTNNWRSAAGFLQHDGLFPSYNYEWFQGFWSWDSWKHAVALARFQPELAKDQIRAMYDFQNDAGMIADCAYRDTVIETHNWRDTKPPLSGWAVWEVFQRTADTLFLKALFPRIEKYHAWWYEFRDHDQNGLCEYGSTDGSLIAAKWESGMDNAVRFDDTRLVRNNGSGWSMNRESVDLNAYLYAEKRCLEKMAAVLGIPEREQHYRSEAEALKTRIQTLFYDPDKGWFFDIDLATKQPLKDFGAEGWIPLWAGAATAEQAEKVRKIMLDTARFATYIPFPTLTADHPRFTPERGYWRGPVWIDQAYFAIAGLQNYGYTADARRFTDQLLDRLEGLKNADGPIRENYHPLTGQGFEASHFSWSAAMLLELLAEY